MKLPVIEPSAAPKLKQVGIRLTEEQSVALKIHCNRAGISTQDAVIAGLLATIPGFPV